MEVDFFVALRAAKKTDYEIALIETRKTIRELVDQLTASDDKNSELKSEREDLMAQLDRQQAEIVFRFGS